MATTFRTHSFRTPKDDAPPYDPSLWEGIDCAFVTKLAHERALERQRSDAAKLDFVTAPPPAIVTPPPQNQNHTQGVSVRNKTLWDKLMNYFFPHKEPVSLAQAVRETTIDDLTMLLQAALSAGDVGLATTVSAELANRRVHLRSDAFFVPQRKTLRCNIRTRYGS